MPVTPTYKLDDLLAHTWALLAAGVRSSRHGMHILGLGTIDESGLPDIRGVVLRTVDPVARVLCCHTDLRSLKIRQLQRSPDVCWWAYDSESRVQLRLYGQVTLHSDDDLADQHWRDTALSSRRCYLAPHAPGTPQADHDPNLPAEMLHRVPTESEAVSGRAHFAVVRSVIQKVDYLHLAHDGHVRATFQWENASADATCQSTWLSP